MHGQPEYTPDPGAVIRMPPMPQPPPSRRGPLIAMFAIAVLLALVLGVAIGRATVEEPTAAPAAPAETSNRGKLKVVSIPADGTVTLDGRFVGVAPLENLDVDPGKHAIVIDVFGYQPYAGIVEVEPRAAAKLSVVLAPLGGTEATTGNVSGGTATRVTVPRSALLPGTGGTGPIDPYTSTPSKVPAKPDPPPRAPAYVPPPRPRRDCNGENRTCRDGCYRADTDCRFSCPGCSSCLSSVGWDECKRQCDSCRNNCEQNKKFCESSCQSQLSICEQSQ